MVGQTFKQYKIIEKLGEGGMGTVYKAHDTRLNRHVALKFLPKHISPADTEGKRFLREAQAASSLDHPNICTIHEFQETEDGRLFIVMPAYEGMTLKELIKNSRPDLHKSLDIIRQISEGLQAAHNKDIIHRDIKSSNIFVTNDDHVKILDFGLAQISGLSQLTKTSSTLGTVQYMSPEQARGEPLDQCTDIWSMGVILFELVTGKLPFSGDYDQAVIYRILNEQHASIREMNPEIPDEIVRIIDKCLEKDPENRYPSVGEFKKDLNRLESAPSARSTYSFEPIRYVRLKKPVLYSSTALLLTILISGVFWINNSRSVIPFSEREQVLIADFNNQTGDSLFDRSLMTAFTSLLEQSRHARLYPRSQLEVVLQRMNREPESTIGEDLGIEICQRENVRGLIVPGIVQAGNRYSISARLIDPQTGEAVASYSVEAPGENEILPALDRLSRSIRRDLGESLYSIHTNSQELFKVTTPSLQALKYYSDGVYAWGAGNYDEATRLQQRALEIDPDFASAHAALGIHYTSYIYNDMEKGKEHFERALELTERTTERELLFIRAAYTDAMGYENDAEELYRVYVQSYPDDWRARSNLARLYMMSNRAARAIDEFSEVLKLVPNNTSTLINLAVSHSISGNYGEALEYYDAAFDLDPSLMSNANTNREYGVLLVKNGSRDEARSIYNSSLDMPIRALGLRNLALLDMFEGKYQNALPKLREAALENQADGVTLSEARDRVYLAILLGDMGNRQAQLLELETAESLLSELSPQLWMLRNIGSLYAKAGETERAVRILQQLREFADSDSPDQRSMVQYLEGEVEMALGNITEAINHLSLSYRTNENEFALGALGRAYYIAGDYPKATEHFENFLSDIDFGWEIQQDWLAAHITLSEVYLLQGDNNKAANRLNDFFDLWQEADENIELHREALALRASM